MTDPTARRCACGALLLALASVEAAAQQAAFTATDARTLDAVVVLAPLQEVPAFDVPVSSTVIDLESPQRAAATLPEALAAVPGVLARDRQNLAQDTQLSIRGFGARATFGVRGLRLYADGIPATMPDGQGQVSHFALLGGGSIDVLRGPFSALHGNSSGGVVAWRSAAPTEAPEFALEASAGRDDTHAVGARLRGTGGPIGYNLSVQRMRTDGYRDHSEAQRTYWHGKAGVDLGQGGRLQLVASRLDAPDARDPLGLTLEQARVAPTQAIAAAYAFDTRKSVRHQQLGLVHAVPLGAGTLQATAWTGARQVQQVLAVPVAAQANPLSAGGVIDLDDAFGGLDLRWSWRGEWAGRAAQLTLGVEQQRQRQHRRGFENFDGGMLGVRGALRRDERNRVQATDQYLQAWWQLGADWSLLLGARHGRLRFASRDAFITAVNPDDSGVVTFAQTTPVVGLVYAPNADTRLYLSSGRGFETPTFNELGYRADGGAGLALDLRPAVSRNLELGGKWRGEEGASLEAAVFRAETRDELAVARNVGGRSSYRNVATARRDGFELALAWPLSARWSLQAAYTGLDARFRNGFPICSGAGCQQPGTWVAAGTRIPGVAPRQWQLAAHWRAGDWWAALEGLGAGAVAVNDVGDEAAPGFALGNLSAGWQGLVGGRKLDAFLRIDNLLDRRYIGSVIVNEGNRRYHEPGAGRGVQVGLRWHWDAVDRFDAAAAIRNTPASAVDCAASSIGRCPLDRVHAQVN